VKRYWNIIPPLPMANIANAQVRPRSTMRVIAPRSRCDMLFLLSDFVSFLDVEDPFNKVLKTNTNVMKLSMRIIPTGAKKAA
jgi:hypothetical protein